MSILECLQDAGFSETATLSEQCEKLVWDFKVIFVRSIILEIFTSQVKITQDDRFVTAAKQYCEAEMQANAAMQACTTQTQSGYALSCLIEFTQNVTQTSKCHAFLCEFLVRIVLKTFLFSSNGEISILWLSSCRPIHQQV